jgi:hypothetical protein
MLCSPGIVRWFEMKNLRPYWRPIAIVALSVAGSGQVTHSGEDTFVILVKGGRGVTFRGSYRLTGNAGESKETKVEGAVPAEFRVAGTGVYLSFQNQSPGGEIQFRIDPNGSRQIDKDPGQESAGPFLEVAISKNGSIVKKQRTEAPYGVVMLSTTMPPWGAPRQTELRVDGSVKFASLTLTTESGDTEQQLVPIPFSKTFFTKAGWIVGLLAQKALVTRLDPLSPSVGPTLQVMDDGRKGSLHLAIRVNGRVVGEAETSEPFGVASATVPIQ